MNIAIIAFSKCGAALAGRISDAMSVLGGNIGLCNIGRYIIARYIIARHADEIPPSPRFEPFSSVYALTENLFGSADALVFVGACGIAVRAVAPLLKSKLTDPAVVVCDEAGRFSVSLLSGHAGGANSLAEQIAEITGAAPVITTASDARAAAGGAPQPRNLVLGVGCRRGLSAEAIERAVTVMLWDNGIGFARVCEIATIDVKRSEDGLLGFAKAFKLPLRFYTAEELAAVPGDFTSSEFVLHTVGVDNVCERAAVTCGGKGGLIMRKTSRDGVTAAVFEKYD